MENTTNNMTKDNMTTDNMTLNIHFFRNNQKGRIDYQEIFQYFMTLSDFEIQYDDSEVNIIYTDNEFGFKYMYKITRVSQVQDIYKLDPAYLNINFMLCLPILIPSFAAKEILDLAQRISRLFDLQVYHSSFTDVRLFNVADLNSLFADTQSTYLEEHTPKDKILYDSKKLNAICKYQRNIDCFNEQYHYDVTVNPCVPIIDYKNNEFGICTTWNAGIPSLFVPYFDFVNVKEESGESFYIRRADFMKFMEKYLTKVDNSFEDLYCIKSKGAKSSKSVISKLRKYAITDQEFVSLPLCDLLDKH